MAIFVQYFFRLKKCQKLLLFFFVRTDEMIFFRSPAVRDIVGWFFLVARWLRRWLPQKWHFLATPHEKNIGWYFSFFPHLLWLLHFHFFDGVGGLGMGGGRRLALVVRDTRCLLRLNPSVARANNRTSRQIRKVFGRENMVFLKVVEFYPQWIFFSCVKTLEKKNHFLRNSLLSMYRRNMELMRLSNTS